MDRKQTTTKKLTLKHSLIWMFLGSGVWSVCNWLMSTILAKLGTPVKLGQYSLGNLIAGPVFMFTMTGLRSYMVSDVRNRFNFRDYFSFRLFSSALALIAVSIFAVTIYRRPTALVVIVVAVGMLFDSISDIAYAIFQKNDHPNFVGFSMISKGLVNVTLFASAMYITRQVIWAAAGNSLASLIIVAFYDLPTCYSVLKKGNPSLPKVSMLTVTSLLSFRTWKALLPVLIAAIPLALITLFNSTTGSVPQFFISKMLGVREVGLYAAAAYFVNVGRIGILAAGNAASPYLARAYANNKYIEFRNILLKLIVLGVFLAVAAPIVASFVGKKAMTVLYTSEYAQQTKLIVLILLAGGIRYLTSLMGYSVTAARHYTIQIYWFGITFAVAVLSSFWFIPRQGLEGAAISAILAACTELVIGSCILINLVFELKKKTTLIAELEPSVL